MNTISSLDIPEGVSAKYLALSEAIRTAVSEGRLAAGDRLPPVRELAYKLSVTPGTVSRAYQRLTDAGVLEAQVGRGTFVARQVASVAPTEGDALDLLRPSLPEIGQAAMIRRAFRQITESPDALLLDYPGRAQGFPLRAAIADGLQGMELGPFTADDVILTHGAQHAYVLVLQTVLKGDGPAIATEALSYPGFRHGARLARAEVLAVESDAEGPIPASLAAACDQADIQVFATSSFAQNPTTVQTTLARRQEIAELARARRFRIVEDECYGRNPRGIPTYRALAPELVWYLGSFSKGFSAALRIGYAIAPKGRLAEARQTTRHNSFGVSYPIAAATAQILSSPDYPRVRAAVEAAFAERMRFIGETLKGFAVSWREDVPFAFLRLPAGWRTSGFLRAAEERGVLVRPAEDFVLIDGRAPNAVRIAANARVPMEAFKRGVIALRELLEAPPHEIDV